MTLCEMTKEIAKLAPITGITSTGRIDFLADATDAQREAAQAYLEAHLAELNETPKRFLTQRTIRLRLRAVGLEAAADAALDANPEAKRDWLEAQDIATDDPQVRSLLTAIGANPEEILA